MEIEEKQNMQQSYSLFGMFTFALRLVVGWTYFSAFWRRLILENKLIPDTAGYIGEKFNFSSQLIRYKASHRISRIQSGTALVVDGYIYNH